MASLISAMWHSGPSKQLTITDQRQENSQAVEIYRIEKNIKTEFKTSSLYTGPNSFQLCGTIYLQNN